MRSRIASFLAKALLALTFALCLPELAQAQKVNVFAALDGNLVVGRVYFSGGGVAENVDVDVLSADNLKIATVKTNAKGEFIFVPKMKDAQYTFCVDTGDGHAAKTTVSLGGAPAGVPSAQRPPSLDQLRQLKAAPALQGSQVSGQTTAIAFDPALADAISLQIEGIKAQIDAYQSRIRLCDILGALGYLVGIAGTIALLYARRLTAKAAQPAKSETPATPAAAPAPEPKEEKK